MTRKRSQKFEILAHVMLVLVTRSLLATGAPLQEAITDLQSFSDGCYYNYNHYNEADRILTNEPCLNCTCHNKMLMCYLRVCPFSKPIGHDCVVEKREDQCCPTITCPEVPVELSHHLNPSSEFNNGLSIYEKFGCTINNKFYPEGAQVPSNSNKPCELCYCIKNRTSCIIQECTLHIDGCQPVYPKGACCPVSYNCDRKTEVLELEDLSITTTTIRPTQGFILTSTTNPLISMECEHDRKIYKDGVSIKSNNSCEHCYCMRGDIVCAVQECEMKVVDSTGKSCRAAPPTDEDCCPSNYICEEDRPAIEINDFMTTTSNIIESKKLLTPTPQFISSPADLHGLVSPEDVRLQEHINFENSDKNITSIPQVISHDRTENETGSGDSGVSTNRIRESEVDEVKIATTEETYSEPLTTEGFTNSMLTGNFKLTTSEPTKENKFISTESNFAPEAMNFELPLSRVENSTNEVPQYNQTFESNISLKEKSEYSFNNLSSRGIYSTAQPSLPPEIQTETWEEYDTSNLLMFSEDHKTENPLIGSLDQKSFLTTLETTTSSSEKEIYLETMSTISTNLMTTSNVPDGESFKQNEEDEESLKIETISPINEFTTSSSSLSDLIVTYENMNILKNQGPTTLSSVDDTSTLQHTTTDEKLDETSLSSLGISERLRFELSNSTQTPEIFAKFHQSIPAVIPGEGDCLINNITYNNNTQVPTSNVCELSCKCSSSILVCKYVKCELPDNIEHCILEAVDPNKCCPSYICDKTENKKEVQLIKLNALDNYSKDLDNIGNHLKSSSVILNVSSFENVVTQGQTTTEQPTPYFTKEETGTSYLMLDFEAEDYQKETDQPVLNQLGQTVSQTEKYTIANTPETDVFSSEEKEKGFTQVPTSTLYFRASEVITDDATTTSNPFIHENKLFDHIDIDSSEEDGTTQKYFSASDENTSQKNLENIEDDQESTTSLNNVINIEKKLISTQEPLIKHLYENSSNVQVSQKHNEFEIKEHSTTPQIKDENFDYISSYEKTLVEIPSIPPYNENEESSHHTVVSNFQTIRPVPEHVVDFFVSESTNSASERIPIVSTSITDVFPGLEEGKLQIPPVNITMLLDKDEMTNDHQNSSKGNDYAIESLTRTPIIELQSEDEFTVANENENRIKENYNQITSTTIIVPTTEKQTTQTFTEQNLPDTDIISSFEDLGSTKFGLFNVDELLTTKGYNSMQTYTLYPETTADISYDSFSEKENSHNDITSTEEATSNAFLESDTQNSFPTTVKEGLPFKPTNRLKIGEHLTTDYWFAEELNTESAPETKFATKIELNSQGSTSVNPESFSDDGLQIATESVEENFIPHTFIPTFPNHTIRVTPSMPSKNVNRDPITEGVTTLFNDPKNDVILTTRVDESITTTNLPKEYFKSTIIISNTKAIEDDFIDHSLEGDKLEFDNDEATTIKYNERINQDVTEGHELVNSTLIMQKNEETTSVPSTQGSYTSIETTYNDENTSPTKVPVFEKSTPKEVLFTESYTSPKIFLEYFEPAQNINEEMFSSTSTEHSSVAQIFSIVTETTIGMHTTHNNATESEKEEKNTFSVNDDQSFLPGVEKEQWLTTTTVNEIADENTSTAKTESEEGYTVAIDSFQKEKEIPPLLFGNDFKESLKGTPLPELEATNTHTHMSFVLSTDSTADKPTYNTDGLENSLSVDKDEGGQMSTLGPLLFSETKPPRQVGDSHKMESNMLLVATSSTNSAVEEGTKNIKNEITDLTEKSTNSVSFMQSNTTEENLDLTTKISATTAQIESASDLRIFENSSPTPQILPITKGLNEFTSLLPAHTTTTQPSNHPLPSYDHAPAQYPTYSEDEYTDEDEAEMFGPGTCRYGGKLFVSAQQIPRDDPCDFCFCFRSDIICLQQSCPPPIAGCKEEPINGFCCPRYECPVSMANNLNITTSTTTTSTTLPPHFLPHAYRGTIEKHGCHIQGKSYKVGDKINSASGPCMYCSCGGDGQMKCDPKTCSPEPTLKQMIAVTASRRR